jgi:hypothetical protein
MSLHAHGKSPLRTLCSPFSSARAAALLAVVLTCFGVSANETDQFLLPTDRPFADVGPLITGAHYSVLQDITEDLNKQIRRAQDIGNPERRRTRLEALHSPRRLADMVRHEFGAGFFETLGVESLLKRKAARAAFPDGTYLRYQRPDWIYSFAHLPIDPRNLPLLVPSSTIRVYGHYIGTDKLGHFHDLGHYYFRDFVGKLASGRSDEEAVDEVVRTYSRGIISERSIIGFVATGVHSNADLASNYMGFKFYRNLTEPVMLQGREHPPLLVLVGGYWKLNTHVRPDSDFMAPFFSDHWNEALNPCEYEWGLRNAIRRKLHARSDEVLAFYCDVDERPRDPQYFADLADDLASYHGEDYGHFSDEGPSMSIATACFANEPEDTDSPAAPPSAGSAPAGGRLAWPNPRARPPSHPAANGRRRRTRRDAPASQKPRAQRPARRPHTIAPTHTP